MKACRSGPFAISVLALLSAIAGWFVAVAAGQAQEPGAGHIHKLNNRFLGPKLDVQKFVRKFESDDRDVYKNREAIMKALAVKPGARVADVGAGTGLFTRMLAREVGDAGWVFAVDISPGFLEHISTSLKEKGIGNVTPILSRPDSVCLPPDSVDIAFVCDTYHHVEAPGAFLSSIHSALAGNGELAVVEFSHHAMADNKWLKGHLHKTKKQVIEEIEAAGYLLKEEKRIEALKDNYFLVFKAVSRSSSGSTDRSTD